MPTLNPNWWRENPRAGLDYINKWSTTQTFEGGAFYLRDMFSIAIEESTEVGEQVRAFVSAMANKYTNPSSRAQLAQVHTQVAKLMQRAILADYAKAQAQFGRNIAPYRQTKRDAGGKLRRALGAKSFYRGTYDGIGIVNTTVLDSTARQWHRLNFGARPAGTYTPTMYQVRFGNLVAGSFGFADEEPSAGFMMPKGVFSGDGAFYPKGRALVTPTRGIQAWNFLDAGPRVMAERIGPGYEGLYKDWFESYTRGLGPFSRLGNVPRPRYGSFRPLL